MHSPTTKPLTEADRPGIVERLRAATESLERVAADRALLAMLPSEERQRLLQAAGEVFHPDPIARRRLLKTVERLRRVERSRRDQDVLADTGIRALRRQTVFTTPRAFAPREFVRQDIAPGPDDEHEELASTATPTTEDATARSPGSSVEPRACYVCKDRTTQVHPFYDRLCAACGEFNFG